MAVRDREIRKMECQQCSYKFGKVPGLKTTADSIQPYASGVWAYHENGDSTVFDATAIEQGLGSERNRMFNPIGRLVSGGVLVCPDFRFSGTGDGIYASTDYRSWNFTTTKRADADADSHCSRRHARRCRRFQAAD